MNPLQALIAKNQPPPTQERQTDEGEPLHHPAPATTPAPAPAPAAPATENTTKGIPCPSCGNPKTKVDRTKGIEGAIERFKRCEQCNAKFRTVEAFIEMLSSI